MAEQPKQRVTVIYTGGSEAAPSTFSSVVLQDPARGKAAGYLVSEDGKQLLELQQFKQMFSSWLVDGQLLADGGVHACTPLDPLFVLLPLLDRARKKTSDCPEGVFSALEQVLEEAVAEWPGVARLLPCVTPGLLACVCDIKDVSGDKYFRLSEQRALAWLSLKVAQAKSALESQLSGMEEGDKDAYVCGLLSEYLTPAWSATLHSHFKVTADQAQQQGARLVGGDAAGGQPQAKRAKVDPKELAREAARKKAAAARAEEEKKQAAGMAKMTSFFKPKAK